MKISVIIAAYNKPYHLERTLHGYDVQTEGNFEVIVAEDGMSPDLRDVVLRFQKLSSLKVTHLTQEDIGFRKTVALNKAIKAADGEYLIFTDDDCVPRRDLIATHRYYAKPGQYIVGAYNRLPEVTSLAMTIDAVRSHKAFSLFWLMRKGYFPSRGFLRIIVPKWLGTLMDKKHNVSFGRFPGGNSSCYRADAVKLGGFNEKMSYGLEDREFGTRLCHAGIVGRRVKNSTFMLHLNHDRPYQNFDELMRNKTILDDTVDKKLVRSSHAKDKH